MIATNQSPNISDSLRRKIANCPLLGSLRSINETLSALVNAEDSMVSQIAEVTSRDPSMASRMLRMANSPFYALASPVGSLEEAILLLGLKQVKELIMAAPMIEDLSRLGSGNRNIDWNSFWTHSLGCAILTREIVNLSNQSVDSQTDYLAGLLHNVGKVVLFAIEPESAGILNPAEPRSTEETLHLERELVGADHAAIGALYLDRHHLPAEILQAVRHHNCPAEDTESPRITAAVHLADRLLRSSGILCLNNESHEPRLHEDTLKAWNLILKEETPDSFNREKLTKIMDRLPAMLQQMLG